MLLAQGSSQYVFDVAKDIGKYISHYTIVINKSTVPVGTTDKVKQIIQEELDRRNSNLIFDIASNPEFLKEGVAIENFMKPDRVVVGIDNQKVINTIRELYSPFVRNRDRFIVMDIKSSEMTKYTANAMLATKISFINEIANICEKVGANINKVRIGIGSDSRIGYDFIYAGCGYGGSCFPKDIKALEMEAEDNGYTAKILKSVQEVNNEQKLSLVRKVVNRFGGNLNEYTFAVWGLSFKPETDDMREAPSIIIINELSKLGAKIQVYDPKAIEQAKKYYLKDNQKISYFRDKYKVLDNADALILITEWKEFRSPDFKILSERLKNKIIFDGRNQYNKERLKSLGFEYYQIGVSFVE